MEKVFVGKIKKLEWTRNISRSWVCTRYCYRAESSFGLYHAVFYDKDVETHLYHNFIYMGVLGTLDELKKAAQEDFEKRVKECFEPETK